MLHLLSLLVVACAPVEQGDPAPITGCDASVVPELETTAIATSPRIRFTTDEPVAARVVFDDGDGTERRSNWDEPTTDHAIPLLGVLPESSFRYRVEVQGGEEASCLAEGAGESGPLPPGMPEWSFEAGEGEAMAGFTVVPLLSATTPPAVWLVVLDERGRAVWSWSATEAMGANYVSRVLPARDGNGFLFNAWADSAEETGVIGRVTVDGRYSVVAEVEGLHTDFVELSEGRIAALTWDIREFDGEKILGDDVVVAGPEMAPSVLWSSFDAVPFDPNRGWATGLYAADPEVLDWSHVNGINWDEASGDLFVTMSLNDGVARIDGTTGDTEWFLGNNYGDFDVDGEAPVTGLPHSVQLLDDGHVLVFNRGFLGQEPMACSNATEVALDPDTGEIATVGRWTGPDCMLVMVLGSSRRLSNGHLLLDWSTAGRIDELDPEGALVSSVVLDAGAGFAFAEHLDVPAE